MKPKSFNTPWQRSSGWARGLALVSLAAGAWGLSAGAAHARGGNDVYWSIGVSQPGVSVGVSNAPPPRVVYREPVVVYQEPRVIYREPGWCTSVPWWWSDLMPIGGRWWWCPGP